MIDAENQLGGNCFGLYVAVELDGTGFSAEADGLAFSANAAGSVVRGLAIGGFSGDGIDLGSAGNTIACNRIGTDATGTVLRPNGHGIRVTAANNEIGGTGATRRTRSRRA